MKTCIYTNYSENNRELAELTAANKQQYADRHGYTLISEVIPWEEAKLKCLVRVRELLQEYEAVMMIGSDVLFMTHTITIESRCCYQSPVYDAVGQNVGWNQASYPLTLARENLRWWPINNDVTIWTRSDGAEFILKWLIEDWNVWKEYPWLWQNHLWNILQTNQLVQKYTHLVEARVMNSTHQEGLSRWQLGDWIIHFLDYPNDVKMQLARQYLAFVGDGTFFPHKVQEALQAARA